jgi:hypothetical protein
MLRIVRAGALQPGDIVLLKHGAQAVSHTITYPLLTPSQTQRFVDVFFVGQSYPLYFREDMDVDVTGHIDLAAVEYAIRELSK